jgi:methyl-accepting chemotaxis protein
MSITNEDISFWGSALVIMGVVFSIIKGIVVMKEKIRVLDGKFDSHKEDTGKKFDDIESAFNEYKTEIKVVIGELKKEVDKLRDSNQQAQKELIKIINKNHISLLEKISEAKK